MFSIIFSLIIIIIHTFSTSPSNSLLMLLWLMPRISFQFFGQNSPANRRRPFPDSCHNSCFHKNISELLSSLKPTQQIPKITHICLYASLQSRALKGTVSILSLSYENEHSEHSSKCLLFIQVEVRLNNNLIVFFEFEFL